MADNYTGLLGALKFVQGAVSKKDLVPALQHFHIKDGHIFGANGRIALSSPIALDLEACPKALPFVRAIETCESEVSLSVTPAQRLAIKSGNFKAFIECTAEPHPVVVPDGEFVDLAGIELLGALRTLLPFTAEDASRPWAMGLLFSGQSIYATNNVILVQQWLPRAFPRVVNLPKFTAQELLRIGENPIGMQICEASVTFFFEGKRWLHSLLYSTAWPDVDRILDSPASNLALIPEGFFAALADVTPFANQLGQVFLDGNVMTTSLTDGDGAAVEVKGLNAKAIFHVNQLRLLEGVALKFDPSTYPRPCPFIGDMLRGVIVGMRQ